LKGELVQPAILQEQMTEDKILKLPANKSISDVQRCLIAKHRPLDF